MRYLQLVLAVLCCFVLLSPCRAAGPYVETTETVVDQSTSLVWQKQSPDETYTWQEALAYCESLSLAGQDDWRLPGIRELMSIIDYSRATPYQDPVFAGSVSNYWSSTTNAETPAEAWGVFFYDGDAAWYDKTDTRNSVRCVRDGLPVNYSFTLRLEIGGSGSGAVEILPGAATCRNGCSNSFAYGTTVMLRPVPDSGSSFTGWTVSGCQGQDTCTLTIYEDLTIEAVFFRPGYAPANHLLLH